jgi:hypothetical protein
MGYVMGEGRAQGSLFPINLFSSLEGISFLYTFRYVKACIVHIRSIRFCLLPIMSNRRG